MTITVTNTNNTLMNLLNANDRSLATNNAGDRGLMRVTLYNADTISTEIVYYNYGKGATIANGFPIIAPSGSGIAGDSYTFITDDLSKVHLISNVSATTVNVIIEPHYS
jgi:hypothetical protein